MTEAVLTRPAPRQRSRWIPWCFLAGFAVVLGANGTLVYFATRVPVALVTEKPFERGVAYNRLLDAAAAQAALGWQIEVTVLDYGAATERARLRLNVATPGEGLEGALATLVLSRPLEGDRLPPHAAVVVGGAAVMTVDGVRPGQWSARITLEQGSDRAHFDRRLVLR